MLFMLSMSGCHKWGSNLPSVDPSGITTEAPTHTETEPTQTETPEEMDITGNTEPLEDTEPSEMTEAPESQMELQPTIYEGIEYPIQMSDKLSYETRHVEYVYQLPAGTVVHEGDAVYQSPDEIVYYEYSIDYPVFSGSSPLASLLNEEYTSLLEYRKTPPFSEENLLNDEGELVHPPYLIHAYFKLTVEITVLNDRFLSIKESGSMSLGGSAHPLDYGRVFDVDSGEAVEVRQLIKASNEEFWELVKKYGDVGDGIPNGAYLDEDGIVLMFQGPAAIPPVEVTIPYTDTENFTADASVLLSGG